MRYLYNSIYDATGRPVEQWYGLNTALSIPYLQQTHTYFPWTTTNGAGRLATTQTGVPGNLTSLQDLDYTYDSNGNILTILDTKLSQTQTFTYDALNRLTSAKAIGGTNGNYGYETYAYDASDGTLTNKAGLDFAYNDPANIHAVTDVDGVQRYTYDANGNQTQRTVSTGNNLVTNPGFETTGIWSGIPGSAFPGTSFYKGNFGTADEHTGAYGYSVSNHAYGNLQSDLITVIPGASYDLKAWVKGELDTDDSEGKWIIRLLFYDSNGNYLNQYQDAASGGPGSLTTSWTQKGGTIAIPANAGKVQVWLYNYMNAGWVAYDDVSLIKVGTSTNLVLNPGFESGANWTQNVQTGFPATSFWRGTWGISSPKTGAYSYVISNLPIGTLQSDLFPVTSNASYTFSAWVRGELDGEGADGAWILRVVFYDSSGNNIGYQDAAEGGPGTISTTWAQKSGTVTIPANATQVRLQLRNELGSGWVAFDDASFIKTGTGFNPNLITNSGFENTTFWTEVTNADFPGTSILRSTWGTATPHGGTYAYAISNHLYATVQSSSISVSANTQYEALTWVRGELDGDDSYGAWKLRIWYYDSNGDDLSYEDLVSDALGTLNTTWSQQGGFFTTPANTASVKIELISYMNSGWVAFDDVSLKPVATYDLTYDAENRITNVKQGTTTIASFIYDGDGNRVKATVSGVTTTFVGTHFEWHTSTTNMVKYYFAGSQRIAMRTGNGTSNTSLQWLTGDHLGSTSVVTNYDGTNPITTLYKPWGEVRYQSGTLPTDYTYTGQYSHTDDFGLMFYNARWYDPYLARFIQADSIVPSAAPIAWDRYAYVLNNPLRYSDPTGHFTEDEMCEYWGYCGEGARDRALEELGSLFYVMWGTEIGFGDLLIWDEGNQRAMFVLLENEDGTYSGAIWSITGGRQLAVDELAGIEKIAGYSYDSSTDTYSMIGTVTNEEFLGWFGGEDPKLGYTVEDLWNADVATGVSFYTYYDMDITWLATTTVSVILLFTPASPYGWLGIGIDIAGIATDGFSINWMDGPVDASYPVVFFPSLDEPGRAPHIPHATGPKGTYGQ